MLKKFIDLAEQKVKEAQAKADAVQSSIESATPSANVDDLEAIETPETILLATVSGEQSKDRTDRAIVTPWLKFLWETYRTVLEILKNNARLEVMYQATAHQAFQFCLKYTRKTEFRRLCELLRTHVQNAAKYASQMHAINLSDPETLQRHLDTRFQQLNVAVELELWQEAFRSVEDIYLLLSLSKRPAKNIMMSNYYEKLTKIFLVSDNFLFHAAAWSRYYNLLQQSVNAVAAGQSPKKDNPVVTEADLTKTASFVVLSALAIPVISTSRSRGTLIDVDEARKNKNTRLTNLLSMPSAPTRAGLFKDAINKGLLQKVRPEIRSLYNILEVDFHPLSICKKISPILSQIGADPEMEKYVLPLQQVILTRLFQQLSQVYESVGLSFVYNLARFPEPFKVSESMIEKFIMNGCKKGDLAIRLDHTSGVLTFDSDVFSSAKALHAGSAAGSAEGEVSSVQRLQNTPAEIARSQLTKLAKTLHVTCMYVDPSYNAARLAAKEAAFARAEAGAQNELEENLSRRAVIDKKKEAASEAILRKRKEDEQKRLRRERETEELERARIKEQDRNRQLQRIQEETARIRRQQVEKELKELSHDMKINIEGLNLDELDSSAIRGLKLSQLEKEKNEKESKIRVTAKRIDHLERAFRREELKHLSADYERQCAIDLEVYEANKETTLKEALLKHKAGLKLKHRLGRLVGHYDKFKAEVAERRHDEFERRRKAAERDFENKKRQRIKEHRERKIVERQAREAEERRVREEQERAEREAAEKAAKEEERRRQLAERKAQAEAERAKLDEIARKQAEREAEAEARRAARRAALAPTPAPAPAPAAAPVAAPAMDRRIDSNERIAPRLPLVGRAEGGGWRERQAAKAEAAARGLSPTPSTETAPPVQESPRRSGYVPPALRESGATSARGSPRESPRDLLPNGPATNGGSRGGYVPPHLREGRSLSRESPPPGSTPSPDATQETLPRRGGYVPPHQRNK